MNPPKTTLLFHMSEPYVTIFPYPHRSWALLNQEEKKKALASQDPKCHLPGAMSSPSQPPIGPLTQESLPERGSTSQIGLETQ